MSVSISGVEISSNSEPFIIAEMSGNHNQSLEKAINIVEAAAKTGVQAIKLQTYTADTITLNIKGGDFEIKDNNSLWHGKNLHELYAKASTPWEWHAAIFKKAKDLNLICFSSPFDESAVDFLEDLNTPAYKIASFENNHIPLIKKVALTGKPLIISTGMASLGELEESIAAARDSGAKDIILLKCTSSYPASPQDTNIKTIPHLKKLFNCEVGLSDHTLGIGVGVASIALGASVIEKHFTLSRDEGGVDSAFSLEPNEMKLLVEESKRAWQAIGSIKYGPTEKEKNSLIFRRSIYVSEDINKGEKFTTNNLRIVRPGFGESPAYYERILGKISPKDLKKGTPFKLENFL